MQEAAGFMRACRAAIVAIVLPALLPACKQGPAEPGSTVAAQPPVEPAAIAKVSTSTNRASEPVPERGDGASSESAAKLTNPINPPTPKPQAASDVVPVEQLYKWYCAACHSLEIVESQRLGRADWEWVMEDMVGKYGGSWITTQEQKQIIDYLVEHHGPKSP